ARVAGPFRYWLTAARRTALPSQSSNAHRQDINGLALDSWMAESSFAVVVRICISVECLLALSMSDSESSSHLVAVTLVGISLFLLRGRAYPVRGWKGVRRCFPLAAGGNPPVPSACDWWR